MDLDAELERLSREARAKLDAERGPEPAPTVPAAKGTDDALDERIAALARPARPVDEAVAEPEAGQGARAKGSLRRPGSLPLGAKLVLGGAALVGVLVILNVVLLPLLKAGLILGLLLLAAWVALKFMGVDLGDDEDEEKPAR